MQVHKNPDPTFRAEDFFETSALLITFISLGRFLEAAARGRTSRVSDALLRLPKTHRQQHLHALTDEPG